MELNHTQIKLLRKWDDIELAIENFRQFHQAVVATEQLHGEQRAVAVKAAIVKADRALKDYDHSMDL
jgi:hypothetical protein